MGDLFFFIAAQCSNALGKSVEICTNHIFNVNNNTCTHVLTTKRNTCVHPAAAAMFALFQHSTNHHTAMNMAPFQQSINCSCSDSSVQHVLLLSCP